MNAHGIFAAPVLALALAACASAPASAEIAVAASAPIGFLSHAPTVQVTRGEVRVRGVLCRAPLSTRVAPQRLDVSLEDGRGAMLVRQSTPLSPLPVGRGARCVTYRIALPQHPDAARATLSFTGS